MNNSKSQNLNGIKQSCEQQNGMTNNLNGKAILSGSRNIDLAQSFGQGNQQMNRNFTNIQMMSNGVKKNQIDNFMNDLSKRNQKII